LTQVDLVPISKATSERKGLIAMEHSFSTSAGTVEVVVHEASRIVSVSRLGTEGRPVASAMCDWNTNDLSEVIAALKVPLSEAREIADEVRTKHASLAWSPPQVEAPSHVGAAVHAPAKRIESAGIALRFVAVLLDSLIVFLPLSIVIGLMSGGTRAERTPDHAYAGVELGGQATLFLLFLVLCYYVLAEAYTGMTLGKRIVGIRVVEEDGSELRFGAAVVRNLLRLVDGLFLYLIGAIFAFSSPRGQRIGDRAAHTVVVRRA
jgi:uncharacterized RDD family membrane protein YckC